MDDVLASDRPEVIDDGSDTMGIVDSKTAVRADAAMCIEQHRRQPGRKRAFDFISIEMGSHHDQTVNAAAHGSKHMLGMLAGTVHVGQQEDIVACAGLAVHAAHHFREKFAVGVGKHHANGASLGEA